jgi:hypothetical protein
LSKWKITLLLLLLTLGALVVHGYHPYAEDAEIYLPGIEKILQPSLFPVGTPFFASHAGLTLFPSMIAASVRLTHLPLEYALFGWHVVSLFCLLLASWQWSGTCFVEPRARWGAVVALAALLTLPVAGTALYIMDQYLNPRNLAAVAALFATTRVLEGKLRRAALWLAFGVAVHPLMGSFVVAFSLLLVVQQRVKSRLPFLALFVPFRDLFAPPSPAYQEAMRFHLFHFLSQWQWYEWIGIVAPVGIFWCIQRFAAEGHPANFKRVARALIAYDLMFFAAALLISLPQRLEPLARIQPLRSLHLLYMLLVLIGGGLIAEYILGEHLWRWLALFLPLCAGMYGAQRSLFPASQHVEWPWAPPRNRWTQAFLWIRHNTPDDSFFAIDPLYYRIAGEDAVGFRACARRSRLADAAKDSGAVSMFPPLAEEWWQQFQAARGWKQFSKRDFEDLKVRYGVNWVVLELARIPGLDCPYQNSAVAVCRLAS